jgi:light-regulated signal transduction histidine kinase (bacteriophytochrome)
MLNDPSMVPTIQYRFIDKAGNWKWIESTFSNLLADANVEAIVINFRDVTDRKQAEEEIKKLNEELEIKVVERTNELEKRSRELMDNRTALLNLVEDLNLTSDQLRQSAEKLEAANKELEAFSYSVSHDLRSPLRAISGFVHILLEDYEKVLDDEGKRICSIIHSNATRMGQLIDDLLSFSRLIRSEMHQSQIDMNSIVKNSIQEFKTTLDLSGKTITIEPLPHALGDADLIRQVWINLISNALKYSSKSSNPQIAIGSHSGENETVYFIRDNGVGFNMDYAHKLFGVFQRLHSVNEFEGTGVGLAIVQRIINRHRGRIWAESEIDNGATFYFSLPAY